MKWGIRATAAFSGLMLVQTAAAAEPDAAVLVRQVRDREAWIDKVESLHIKAVQHWTRTPKGIEKLRLANQAGAANNDLRPEFKSDIELAYDRTRIRLHVRDEGLSDDLRIWDGKRFINQNRYAARAGFGPDQDGTGFTRDLSMLSWLVWTNFSCFRAGPHVFWWNSPKERAEIERMTANPEDFAYEGTAEFHGITCHVVSHWDSWTTLFIGVDDGRLHGIRQGAQTTTTTQQSLAALIKELGRQDPGQGPPLTEDERSRLKRLGASRMTKLIDPVFEFRLSLNKEVASGCRLPLVQGIRYFEADENGRAFESQSNELRILQVKINEPLPDSLFRITLREGEWVSDQTHEPPLRYRHKARFSAEEWAAIVAEAKARQQARPPRPAANAAGR